MAARTPQRRGSLKEVECDPRNVAPSHKTHKMRRAHAGRVSMGTAHQKEYVFSLAEGLETLQLSGAERSDAVHVAEGVERVARAVSRLNWARGVREHVAERDGLLPAEPVKRGVSPSCPRGERARWARWARPARSPPALAALTHRARRPRSPLPALAKTKTWSRSEKSQPEPFSMLKYLFPKLVRYVQFGGH